MLTAMALLLSPQLYTIVNAVDGESVQPIVDAERDVRIINGGILFMNDTFTLTAPAGETLSVSSFWTGFHESFTHERASFEVWDSGEWLSVEASPEKVNVFDGFTVEISPVVSLSQGSSLRLRASYLFIDRARTSGNKFSVRIPVYPGILQNISSFEARVTLPQWADYDTVQSPVNFTVMSQDNAWVLEAEVGDVSPFPLEDAAFIYTPSSDDEYLLDVESVTRAIEVRSGGLRIEDTYTMIDTGTTIVQFLLNLPLDAEDIKVRDTVGPLGTSTLYTGESVDLYVTTRWMIRTWDRFTVSVAYTVPKEGYTTQTDGTISLDYPNNEFPHYVRELTATVSRPGAEAVSVEYGPSLPSERLAITVDVPPASIMPTVRPAIILLAAVGIIAAAVYLPRRKPRVVEVKVEAETPKLADYIKSQRERLSLYKEIESLEEELEESRIERADFDRRAAELNREIGALTVKLKSLIKALDDEPEITEKVREIQRAEGEIEKIGGDLRSLEVRLRARRISRKDYERRRQDRARRRSQAVRRIERALETLG